MSDIKALPENLKELEQQAEFKKMYRQFTAVEFEDKLTEVGVGYLSGDDKGDLTWRWLDHEGYDFETQAYRDSEDASNTNSKGEETNETVETDATAAQDGVTASSGDDSGQDDGAGESEADSADADNSQESDNVVNSADTDAPENASNSNESSSDEAKQPSETPNQPSTDSAASNTEAPSKAALELGNEPENFNEMVQRVRNSKPHISVENVGDFDIYEPASRTMITAGHITDIYYLDEGTNKDSVVRNIDQINQTRGNKLHITNK